MADNDYTETLTGTVDEVNAYLDEHPDEREAVLAAEADGQNRKGIVEGPHAQAADTTDGTPEAGAEDGDGTPATTRGATFQEAAKDATPDEVGYLGSSPEAERTGRRDKGLSQRNPAVMNQGGTVPDASPGVDDSEAIKALRNI